MRFLSPIGLLCCVFLYSGELTDQEARGKQIYKEGKSPAGMEIMALLGQSGAEVPGALMACVNCHGVDGKGLPESGVVPSDITWPSLTSPYGGKSATGRQFKPYDDTALIRAITMGMDSSGNALDVTMPRFRMDRQQARDLIAYLKKLGTETDPGMGDDHINLGVLLPSGPAGANTRKGMRLALDAWASDLNRRGGVYNRRIVLDYREAAPDHRIDAARTMMDGPVFAMLAPFAAGIEKELDALAEERAIPILGPLTQSPHMGIPPNRYIFYLYPGLSDQTRALFNFALEKSGKDKPRAVILHAGNTEITKKAAHALEDLNGSSDQVQLETISTDLPGMDPKALAKELHANRVSLIFWLDAGERGFTTSFLAEAERLGWYPRIMVPGSLANQAHYLPPGGFANRIFMAFPSSPNDMSQVGRLLYERLVRDHNLPQRPTASMLNALGAAGLLEEGLRRSGRQSSRSQLVENLDMLYRFETGFTPPVTYNPNRRVGARGAYVLVIDPSNRRLVPASGWVEAAKAY